MAADRSRRFFRFPLPSRKRIASDVDDELEFHLAMVVSRLVADGWGPHEARLEAQRRFGDLELTKQYCRHEDAAHVGEARRMIAFDEITQDLRYALRTLRSAPGFAAVALLTLGLGIGANTAVFSVVNAVLLAPLPFVDSDRLVRAWNANHSAGVETGDVSEPDFLDWKAQSRVAQSMGGFVFGDGGFTGLDLTGDGSPERISTALVTDGFFPTLGTKPFLGQTLQANQHVVGNNRFVVLSHAFWTRRFNADQHIVGRTISLNGEPFTVTGVMAKGFVYPADNTLDSWVPLSFFPASGIGRVRGARFLSVVARLKPGATETQLRADLAAIAARNTKTYPDNPGWDDVTLAPMRDSIVGAVRRPLVILFGAVGLLLLITCVNIASLLLARASARQGELAVRAALGAGRNRIIRQLLTESLVLSVAGGVLGVAIAYASVTALKLGGVQLPGVANVRLDATMLAFTLGASIVSGLIFGLVPAIRSTSASLDRSLRSDARGSIGGAGQRLRNGLVLAEVALSVMLVVGAGLATKSFMRLVSVEPGFETSHALVATMTIGASHLAPPPSTVATTYYYSILDAIRAVPGVTAAGSIRDLPLRGTGESFRPDVAGSTIPAGQGPMTQVHHISTDYFKAMAIPLKGGRPFDMTDQPGAAPAVIVNDEFVRRFWPGESGVGKVIILGPQQVQIVGVVGSVHQNGIAEPVEPAMYVHALRNLRARMSIVVRTTGDPTLVMNAVRRAIWSVDPAQPIVDMSTLDDVVGKSVGRQRVLAWLLGLFGVIGLTLGALGIYGVLAFAVAHRRREIGVRVALGATPGAVLNLIVGRAMLLTGAGIAVGVAGALAFAQTMQSVLYGIRPTDTATFAEVIVVLFVAALLASWLPARRALRIDPVAALRAD